MISNHQSECGAPRRLQFLLLCGVLMMGLAGGAVEPAAAADLPKLIAAQTAVERVYHAHRTGTKRPFAQAVPAAVIEAKVRLALKKEQLLKDTYGIALSPERIAAEVARIDSNTRSPEMLAELKTALGDDPDLYAQVFAKLILVERELRQRFVNDDARHAPQRAKAEALREALLKTEDLPARQQLLKAQGAETGAVSETSWQLSPRPKEEDTAGPDLKDLPPGIGPLGPDAKLLSSPRGPGTRDPAEERKFYFEDLHPELQKVLTAQLTRPGAVSAVIERPQGFLLYLATEKTDESLAVEALTIPKADYSQWVREAEPDSPLR
ncbi:MAG: hypothetical protein ACI8UO_006408 [Verrucomicrobiales bacterium]|jgi:hypothetical protein